MYARWWFCDSFFLFKFFSFVFNLNLVVLWEKLCSVGYVRNIFKPPPLPVLRVGTKVCLISFRRSHCIVELSPSLLQKKAGREVMYVFSVQLGITFSINNFLFTACSLLLQSRVQFSWNVSFPRETNNKSLQCCLKQIFFSQTGEKIIYRESFYFQVLRFFSLPFFFAFLPPHVNIFVLNIATFWGVEKESFSIVLGVVLCFGFF